MMIKNTKNCFRTIKTLFMYVKLSAIATVAMQFILAIIPSTITILSERLYNEISVFLSHGATSENKLIFIVSMLLIVYFVSNFCQFLLSFSINIGIYEKGTNLFKTKLAEKSSHLPLISYENGNTLDMLERANKCVEREIPSTIFMSSIGIVMKLVNVLSILLVLISYDISFLPISILSIFPFYIAKKIRGDEFYDLKYGQARDRRKVQYFWNLFTEKESVREMRVMSFSNYIADKWTVIRDEVNVKTWNYNIKEANSYFLCDVIRVLGYMSSLLISIYLFISGKITIGHLAAALNAFSGMQIATKDFFVKFADLRNNSKFINDYYDFLSLPEEKYGSIDIKTANKLTVNHVSFKYPGIDKYILSNIDLSLSYGEKVAIIGENGSGKSTLCKILLGLYKPTNGNIYIDEYNLNELSSVSRERIFSIVSQHFERYKFLLYENVGISDVSNITDSQKIMDVLLQSDLPKYSDSEKIETQLGREYGGTELSGGEWQKLSIARCLFKESSSIVILDEPTSALDPMIESKIMNQFLEISKDKISIIVLHRLGLCKHMDKIIVMNGGKIVEIGKHDELMKLKGEYYKLYSEQEKWYKN